MAPSPFLRAFRHRNYRLFFGGQAISLVGTWMQQVAQGWLVLQLTHDPLWLGLVSVAQFGPVIVLGLFGGVIADQLPKRKTLIATQTTASAPQPSLPESRSRNSAQTPSSMQQTELVCDSSVA